MKYKKLIVFDHDGTLTESKSKMDEEMIGLFSQLVNKIPCAIICGGNFSKLCENTIDHLQIDEEKLKQLYLYPCSATTSYHYDNGWKEIYNKPLTKAQQQHIIATVLSVLESCNMQQPPEEHGLFYELRCGQICFSLLGQKAPLVLKKTWDPQQKKRRKIVAQLQPLLPDYEIRMGGTTSIDITLKGLGKAFGVMHLQKHLGIDKKDIVYIGDALFEGGNDYPVKELGVDCVQVSGPEETKRIIRDFL